MNKVFIARQISDQVLDTAKKLPVISVSGPRQSGKTTLVRNLFHDYDYYNFESPLTRNDFLNDPLSFLKKNNKGFIIDEFQHIPELMSYIQVISDENEIPGHYVLTGSQNYTMLMAISQSLAGRAALFTLLPFSQLELKDTPFETTDYRSGIIKGYYPRIYTSDLNPPNWYEDYINLYLERDVRQIVNVKDLSAYSMFLKLCAARAGQILNINELAKMVGRDVKTIKSWLSVLEISKIIYFLNPYFNNFNKRIVKSPKLYFYDTGILCALLSIKTVNQLDNNRLIGNIFENFILAEIIKNNFNFGNVFNLYFWNDRNSKEIDLILENGNGQILIEIKSGADFNIKNSEYFADFRTISNKPLSKGFVIYTGNDLIAENGTRYMNWKNIDEMF